MSEELEPNQATIKRMERRAIIFGEEAVTNMLDFMGPVATIEFLQFWIKEIKFEIKEAS